MVAYRPTVESILKLAYEDPDTYIKETDAFEFNGVYTGKVTDYDYRELWFQVAPGDTVNGFYVQEVAEGEEPTAYFEYRDGIKEDMLFWIRKWSNGYVW